MLTAAAIIVAGTLWVFYSEYNHAIGGAPGDLENALRRDTTMTFTTFVMFDMWNALTCRSADRSVFELVSGVRRLRSASVSIFVWLFACVIISSASGVGCGAAGARL